MMQSVIGSTMLGIGTILVSSMFAVLKSLECVHPIIRASWRLQTTFIALAAPSALSIYLSTLSKKQIVPSMQTVWSGCGYALYNVGLCTALAKTSLLRASILSQCAPLFIVLYSINHIRKGEKRGVHRNHIFGVILTLVGTTMYITSTTTTTKFSADGDTTIDPTNNLRKFSSLPPPQGNVSATFHDSQTQEKTYSFIGDFSALIASAGYAIYISCGRQAQKIVPVYVHLPGCVFVATLLVSTLCLVMMLQGVDVHTTTTTHADDYNDFFIDRNNMLPTPGLLYHHNEEEEHNEQFCSTLLGWMCQQYLPRLAFLGIVCGAIAISLINCSLNHVSTLQAVAANSIEPITASIIGIVFFSEPIPNCTAIIAASIIIFAMLLCSTDGNANAVMKNKV